MEKGLFIAAESFPSRSTRLIPSDQLPATKSAAHQTMGKGRSHTHHGFFLVVIESKNILPFRENKKIPRSPWKSVSKGSGGKAAIYLLTMLL